MSIKILFIFVVMFVVGCGRKPSSDLAKTYHQLSLLELERSPESTLAHKKSLSYLNQALEADKQPKYLASKATLLFKMGNVEAAQKMFRKLIASKVSPKLRSDILNNYACLLAQNNQVDKAEGLWRSLCSCDSYMTPEVAYSNLGKLFFSQKKFDQAHQQFEQAIDLAPSFVDAHYYQALVYWYQNNSEKVCDRITTVLQLAPEHQGAQKLKLISNQRAGALHGKNI